MPPPFGMPKPNGGGSGIGYRRTGYEADMQNDLDLREDRLYRTLARAIWLAAGVFLLFWFLDAITLVVLFFAVVTILALALNPMFAILPAFVGSGLVFAGLTNTCGMAMILSRLPYNRQATCDVAAMVRALQAGDPPAPVGRSAFATPQQSCAV